MHVVRGLTACLRTAVGSHGVSADPVEPCTLSAKIVHQQLYSHAYNPLPWTKPLHVIGREPSL